MTFVFLNEVIDSHLDHFNKNLFRLFVRNNVGDDQVPVSESVLRVDEAVQSFKPGIQVLEIIVILLEFMIKLF